VYHRNVWCEGFPSSNARRVDCNEVPVFTNVPSPESAFRKMEMGPDLYRFRLLERAIRYTDDVFKRVPTECLDGLRQVSSVIGLLGSGDFRTRAVRTM
jgi:hypothetical protein